MRLGLARVQQLTYDCFGVGTAIGGTAQAIGNVTAATLQANAARDAAKTTADAADYGATVQGEQNANTLAFNQAQAQNTAQNTEVNRKANYGQWAAHQGDLSSIGAILGLPGKTVPAYVPGVTPNFTSLSLPYPTMPTAPGQPGLPPPYSQTGAPPYQPGAVNSYMT